MRLDVYLENKLIGHLFTDSRYGLSFEYSSDADKSISISIPLSDKVYRRREAEPFFSGLLPDGGLRFRLARNIHVSEQSTIKLLEAYGADIAGAVVILPESDEDIYPSSVYREVGDQELGERIRSSVDNPMLIWGNDIRLSLAGAQDKMPLYYKDGRWFVPEGTSPSNCILKHGAAFSENEYIVSYIARRCGLSTPESFLHVFDGETALISMRYDRVLNDSVLIRLQQEDMCQASGIMPEKKYESDGGPGISKIISLIKSYSSQPALDLIAFIDSVIFNFLIGNCDAHAKNYSFLYGQDNYNQIRLAPLYDLMSTTVYPNLSRELAMNIGKERRIDRITKEDFFAIPDISRKLVEREIMSVASKLKALLETCSDDTILAEHSSFVSSLAEDTMPRINRLLV